MEALRIATNFYTFRMGAKPNSMAIARMESAEGRITMHATTYDENEDDEVTYEIELDPTTDALTLRRVLDEYRVSDFAQDAKQLSELKEGDLFRLESDCVVYRFLRAETLYNKSFYCFTRQGEEHIYRRRNITVYPCSR